MNMHTDPPGNVVPFIPAAAQPHAPAQTPVRTAPCNVDVEQEVLGALLMAPATIGLVETILRPEHFFEQLHAMTFQAIVEISASEGLATEGQLFQRLGRKISEMPIADGVNVRAYLARLAAIGGMTGGPLMVHARVIRDLWALRQIAAAGTDILEKDGFEPGAALTETLELIDEVRTSLTDRGLTTVSLAGAGDSLIEKIQADLRGELAALPSSGITYFDKEIGGGLRPSTLITVGARTSMGKSIFGLEIVGTAAAAGFGCIYHSLEMPREQIAARMAASRLERKGIRMPFEKIMRRGGLTMAEAGDVEQVIYETNAYPLTIEDGGGRTLPEIAASSERIMNAYRRKGIPLGPIVIDHAHIVRPSRRYNREDEGLKEVADQSLALAKRLEVPVILLAQCNRGTESREDKRPGLADLRGAGAFEENSDAVVFLYRPAYYIERSKEYRENDPNFLAAHDDVKHVLEIIIDKNRAGQSNQIVRAWIDTALNAIRNQQENSGGSYPRLVYGGNS